MLFGFFDIEDGLLGSDFLTNVFNGAETMVSPKVQDSPMVTSPTEVFDQ
jgi:hypothetical protein